MLFNSLDFAIFIPIVFAIYWFVFGKSIKLQNAFILLASYFFYACWDWRFLFLILISTVVDYFLGLSIARCREKSKRKLLLAISIIVNIGILLFFKYFNFFIESFSSVFSILGIKFKPYTLAIILPVGISFYTFQTLSYTIDVYNKKLKPSNNFIAFAAFVSFFPQLVAGPIERAKNLLPQFLKQRQFIRHEAENGLKQILWGLFKKMVIADNCAVFVNTFFENTQQYNSSTLLLGAILFSVQIYCDFSGYTDIAIGTSKLFGFNLMKNFNFPYFSRSISEFWRRWHISLTTWFRDYVYIPLGGSRVSKPLVIRNVFIIFIVSGFWHGANWTFIFWGLLHALLFIPLILTNKNRKHIDIVAINSKLPTLKEACLMLTNFFIVTIAWLFFRAENISLAFDYISRMITKTLFSIPQFNNRKEALILILFIIFLFVVEWIGRRDNFGIEKIGAKWHRLPRWTLYYALIFCILYFYGKQQEFIYFQF